MLFHYNEHNLITQSMLPEPMHHPVPCVLYRSVLLACESISHEEFTAVIHDDDTLHYSTIHPWLYVSPLNTPVPRIQLYYHSYVCSQYPIENLYDSCGSALCPETLASAPDAQALGIPRSPNHCALSYSNPRTYAPRTDARSPWGGTWQPRGTTCVSRGF